jgi:hypothetical protein
MTKDAIFIHRNGYYWPDNKDADKACAIMSKMKLKESDMLTIRIKGYRTFLRNGEEIGRVGFVV